MDSATDTALLSSEALARTLLAECRGESALNRQRLAELVRRATCATEAVAIDASQQLFTELIEPLCDSFDADDAARYVQLFSTIVALVLSRDVLPQDVLPRYDAASLVERYRSKRIQGFRGDSPRRVCVLSRVTLGADIAVTSVALDAAKRRFPEAEICFVGPPKNTALFAEDPRVQPLVTPYSRSGLLRDRLQISTDIRRLLDHPQTLVIDPDSRLSQLGVIPICEDERYLFFESRTYGADSDDPLPVLTSKWLFDTLGVEAAKPYLTPEVQPKSADVAVSLGVGGNPRKRIEGDFELQIVAALLATGKRVMIDRGVGGEETERVDRIAIQLGHPPNLLLHDGSFASFASHILQSDLYAGYDSAGQHVAAAGAVPLVTVFAGYAVEKTYQRWKPWGTGLIRTIKVTDSDRDTALPRTLSAISEAVAATEYRQAPAEAAQPEQASQ